MNDVPLDTGALTLSRRLESMTRVAQDTERAAIGAAEHLGVVADCLAAVEGIGCEEALVTLDALTDPVVRRILRARFDAAVTVTGGGERVPREQGWRQTQEVARQLHAEALVEARTRRREADEMEALRQAAEAALCAELEAASGPREGETSP